MCAVGGVADVVGVRVIYGRVTSGRLGPLGRSPTSGEFPLPQSNREMVTNLGLRLGRAGGAYNPPATFKFTDLSTGTQVKYGLVPLVWVAPSQVTAYLPG